MADMLRRELNRMSGVVTFRGTIVAGDGERYRCAWAAKWDVAAEPLLAERWGLVARGPRGKLIVPGGEVAGFVACPEAPLRNDCYLVE